MHYFDFSVTYILALAYYNIFGLNISFSSLPGDSVAASMFYHHHKTTKYKYLFNMTFIVVQIKCQKIVEAIVQLESSTHLDHRYYIPYLCLDTHTLVRMILLTSIIRAVYHKML